MAKIIHLLHTFRPGGAENVALNYSKVLSRLGFESLFIAKSNIRSYEDYIVENGFSTANRLDREMLKNCSCIFVHCNQQLVNLLMHIVYIKKNKIKIVYIQHLYYSENKFLILSKLINYISTDFIQITPITQDLVAKYIKVKIHFLVNFYINKYPSSEYPNIRDEVRKENNIDEQTKLFMFSAVFKPGKGLADFLDIAYLFRNSPEFKFLILGDGQERSLIDNYKYNNIIYLGFKNDIERYLIASDVYVFTSLFKQEMMPMALIEAICCNKSILAYKTEINDFCLHDKTFMTLSEMYKAVNDNSIPNDFIHYDLKYAISKFDDVFLCDEKIE